MTDKVTDGIEASCSDSWYFCFWKDGYRYTGRSYLKSLFDWTSVKTTDTKLDTLSRIVVLQLLNEWREE